MKLLMQGRIAMAALALAALAVTGAGYAKADPDETIDQPDLNGIICQQMALGESPSEIAERLHEGDGRMSIWETGQRVWSALPECG
jgi:hypothetical protein